MEVDCWARLSPIDFAKIATSIPGWQSDAAAPFVGFAKRHAKQNGRLPAKNELNRQNNHLPLS